MTFFSVIFLCNAILFMVLLEDRFRTMASAIVMAVLYAGSLILSGIVKAVFETPAAQNLACIAMNVIILFVASLFLYKNNLIQKIYLTVLAFVNFFYILLVTELLLGVLPIKTAGAAAAIISILFYILFTALMGIVLYRPYRSFYSRSVSGFGIGVTIIQLIPYLFTTNRLTFLFKANPLEGGLFYSTLIYIFIIFAWRSVYSAAKFMERNAEFDGYQKLIDAESVRFSDMMLNIKELKNTKSSIDRALDTIAVMIDDGHIDKVPQYMDMIKDNTGIKAIMKTYSDNPYVSSVIATNALRATRNGVQFESGTTKINRAYKTSELCIVADEILQKAIKETSETDIPTKDKRIRFTVSQAASAINLEAVYSAKLFEENKFSLRGKSISDIVKYLFEENRDETKLTGLELTEEIIRRYSGKLTVSNIDNNVIVRAVVNH